MQQHFDYGNRARALDQGWATSLVNGPYVRKQSPSRAELLDKLSSISSRTTLLLLPSDVLFFNKKEQKKAYTSSDEYCFPPKILFTTENMLSTENIAETVA